MLSWLSADSTAAGIRTFDWFKELAVPGLGTLIALRTVTKYNSDKIFVQAVAIESKPGSEDKYKLNLLSEIEVTNNLTDWSIVSTTDQIVFVAAVDRQLRGLALIGVPLVEVPENCNYNFTLLNGETVNINFKSDFCGILRVINLG